MKNPIVLSIIVPYTLLDDGLDRTLKSVPPEDSIATEFILVQLGEGVPALHNPKSLKVMQLTAPNGTWTKAVETGVQKASGDLIAIFSPGTQVLPESLKEIGTIFSKNPTINVLIGRSNCLDANGNELGLEYPFLFCDHFNLLKIWRNDPPPLSVFFIRTHVLKKLTYPKTGFPERWQEYDLSCSITQNEKVYRTNSYLTATPLLPDDLLLMRNEEIELGIKISRQYWRTSRPIKYGLLFLSLLHFKSDFKPRALALLRKARENAIQRKIFPALLRFLTASIIAPQVVFNTFLFPFFRDRFLRKIFGLFSV